MQREVRNTALYICANRRKRQGCLGASNKATALHFCKLCNGSFKPEEYGDEGKTEAKLKTEIGLQLVMGAMAETNLDNKTTISHM